MSKPKKSVRWLSKNEAILLDLPPKENDGKRKQNRYQLSPEQWEEIKDHRDTKKLSVSGKSTLKNGKGETVLEWTKTNLKQEDILKSLKAAVKTLKESIVPAQPVKVGLSFTNSKLCNQYTLTDYHLGMMSWAEETGSDWDLKIAEDTLVKFFQVAIENSPNAEECIFAQIGDFLHWDGLDAVTPASKHVLDADTRFTKLVRVAIRVIRRTITMLLQKYKKVTVLMAEGNHDPASSVWLRELLNVKGLESVFVGMFKKEFGDSSFVYGHTGHFHHDKIESNLMVMEQHRTLASKDAYSSRGGYMSGRDSKVITYHKDFGEVGRNTINIDMLK